MGTLNRVFLRGTVLGQPEIVVLGHSDKDGDRRKLGMVARFKLVTLDTWSTANGAKMVSRDEHRVVIYNAFLVKLAQEQLFDGAEVLVEGMLKPRSYTGPDGVRREISEVVLGLHRASLELLFKESERGSS